MRQAWVFFISVLLLYAASASASPYDRMIDSAAERHGVDRFVLRSIAQQESGKNPWSFNADGEGFRFESKDNAIRALYALTALPWMAKILPHEGEGSVERRFFRDRASAQQYLSNRIAVFAFEGRTPITQRTDSRRELGFGEGRVRRLNMINTDIGIGQINYRFHSNGEISVQQLFDPYFNLDLAARLLAEHKARRGSDLEAAGFYHSRTPSVRAAYMKRFMPIYKREVARESTQLTSAR